jgi:hypothetical protein
MKYVIEDKQLFNLIYNFIDDIFVEDNLNWNYEEDYHSEEYNKNIIEFSGEKYDEGEIDDKYFIYIKREYYEGFINNGSEYDVEFATNWIDKAPLLDITSGSGKWWCEKLNNFFGEFWKPVFEQWFTDRYPDFSVKTFMYS